MSSSLLTISINHWWFNFYSTQRPSWQRTHNHSHSTMRSNTIYFRKAAYLWGFQRWRPCSSRGSWKSWWNWERSTLQTRIIWNSFLLSVGSPESRARTRAHCPAGRRSRSNPPLYRSACSNLAPKAGTFSTWRCCSFREQCSVAPPSRTHRVSHFQTDAEWCRRGPRASSPFPPYDSPLLIRFLPER